MNTRDSIDPMSIINETLMHTKEDDKREQLGEALYALYRSFDNAYSQERARMERNEKLYLGKHWDVQKKPGDPNAPQPVTPIVFSTIENIKADLMQKVPTVTLKPENSTDKNLAYALTKVCVQDLELNDWDNQYSMLIDDLLRYGWNVMEIGFDSYALDGRGCAYNRRVAPFAFMCDPDAENPQDGRACFKFGTRSKEWFRRHYPKQYENIAYRTTIDRKYKPESGIVTRSVASNTATIIEAWVKYFDTETEETSVHMVKLSGPVVLECSAEVKPEGYYKHGQFPFVITPLYPVNGTPWGVGIPDLHEAAQLYSDKLDQILMKNAYLASHNKLLITGASGFDAEDLADWTKDVHEGEQINGQVQWFSTPPLPSYLLTYLKDKQASIKQESGANDQARGQTSGGVTAASAINALQIMATKRSTMHSQSFHAHFKIACRMLLDVEREFAQSDRNVSFMSDGKMVSMKVTPDAFSKIGDDGKPIEYHIIIETSDQTQYSKMANNEFALQIGQMYHDTIDPIAVLYLMDFPEKDIVIEMIQNGRNSQLIQYQQQIVQMQQLIEQLSTENQQYKRAFSKQAGINAQDAYRQQAQAQMAQNGPELSAEQSEMLENMDKS